MSTLSTHVLDTALGRPAHGLRVRLEDGAGAALGSGETDAEGRLADLGTSDAPLRPGTFVLRFSVGDYFSSTGRPSLYTEIVIQFHITEWSEHYHIPLLLSPFGYSTYRGT